MSIYRSYFLKNNTIVRGSAVNTAKNPATELKYGKNFTKFLFQLDLSSLKTKVLAGDILLNQNTRHYIHLTNCVFGNVFTTDQEDTLSESMRATSFDLILFSIPETWDEGVGYEYADIQTYDPRSLLYSTGASNWTNRATATPWTQQGVYTTNVTGGTTAAIISTQHFDNGNENLHIDITAYINGVLSGGTTDHGLGIAFSSLYETIADQQDHSVSFFTKYTQTFFEPYLETVYDDRIQDDRQGFTLQESQNLCIYVSQNGNYVDLDQSPVVDILDFNKTLLSGYTNLATVRVKKGVYRLTLNLTGVTICEDKIYLYDTWKNLSISGVALTNQTLKFRPQDLPSGISFGGKQITSKKYVPFIYGIAKDEKIARGDKRKVVIECKEQMGGKVILDQVFYRIYVREGSSEVDVLDWTQVNKTDTENNFYLDTEFLIPKEYYMDVKIEQNDQISILTEQLKFTIVSER